MDWSNKNAVTIESQLYNTFVIFVLTIYVFLTLTLMDSILSNSVAGYQTVDSFWLGAVIFFVASHIFMHLFNVYSWKNYLYYYIGGLSIFFPLVLLASILRVSLSLSESDFMSYAQIYCPQWNTDKGSICGEAFALVVYSMTVRALPVVVTIPVLYRWFYMVFPSMIERIVKNGR